MIAKTIAGSLPLKGAIKKQPMWPKVSCCSGTINEAAAPKGGVFMTLKEFFVLVIVPLITSIIAGIATTLFARWWNGRR